MRAEVSGSRGLTYLIQAAEPPFACSRLGGPLVSDPAAIRSSRPLCPHLGHDHLVGQVHATPEPSAAVLGEEPADRLAVPAFGVVGDCVRVDGGLRELGERLAAVLEAPFDEAAAAALDEYLTGQGRRAAVQAWTRLNEGSAGAEQEAEHQEAEHQASWTSPPRSSCWSPRSCRRSAPTRA
ncbi:hypothetical protein GCM10027586_05920 [Kineococcus gypseus]